MQFIAGPEKCQPQQSSTAKPTNAWEDISSTLPYRWVTRVAIDPKDENVIYATFSGLKWADPEIFTASRLFEVI